MKHQWIGFLGGVCGYGLIGSTLSGQTPLSLPEHAPVIEQTTKQTTEQANDTKASLPLIMNPKGDAIGNLDLRRKKEDLPFGIEGVTGLRSNYLYRGLDLADEVLDFQLETEITWDGEQFLELAAWYASGGDSDFLERSVLLGFRKEASFGHVRAIATYRNFRHSLLENGLNLGLEVNWTMRSDWSLQLGLTRDFAAHAWYANLEGQYVRKLSDRSYLSVRHGISWVNDYYGAQGLNDYYGRVSYTYNVNSGLSVTPFIGYSLPFERSTPMRHDQHEFGLWFAVSF